MARGEFRPRGWGWESAGRVKIRQNDPKKQVGDQILQGLIIFTEHRYVISTELWEFRHKEVTAPDPNWPLAQ